MREQDCRADTVTQAPGGAAGLRHSSDVEPGIRRRRAGKRFTYRDQLGRAITDEETLARIRSLVIPPAWRDVWVCPSSDGHVQATGRDARGRKQYRYHPKWREVRDEAKYGRLLEFAAALPGIRDRIERDLARQGMPREKVLATVVRLLEATLIRVGNEEYARSNQSYGLTTLRDRHVRIAGARVQFRFRGKSGRKHAIEVRDRRLAGIVARCRDIPGQELFQYVDESGKRVAVSSGDVNAYLREVSGQEFSAKDFRTWAGTVLAALVLKAMPPPESAAQAKRNVVRAVKDVAEHLGNTPAVARACYVHPAVIEAYEEGETITIQPGEEGADPGSGLPAALGEAEEAVAELLRKRQEALGTQ
jgi:DNA topoisomerase-1